MQYSPATTDLAPVIALHCSGAGAAQWRQLGAVLASRYQLVAPEHYGCDSVGPWNGEHAFTLADEATRTIGLIDRSDCKVHLVGHSYGGGVALRAAVERPDRIASLTLYEPSAFHLLKAMGARGAVALAEIQGIAAQIADGVITGDYRGGVSAFVDYWGGRGAWAALRPSVQAALTRWTPKGPLDFRALIDEPTPASAYADLRVSCADHAGRACARADAPDCRHLTDADACRPARGDPGRRPYGPADACARGQRRDRAASRGVNRLLLAARERETRNSDAEKHGRSGFRNIRFDPSKLKSQGLQRHSG